MMAKISEVQGWLLDQVDNLVKAGATLTVCLLDGKFYASIVSPDGNMGLSEGEGDTVEEAIVDCACNLSGA